MSVEGAAPPGRGLPLAGTAAPERAQPGAEGRRREAWPESGRGAREGLGRDAGLGRGETGPGGQRDAQSRSAGEIARAEGRFAATLSVLAPGTSPAPAGASEVGSRSGDGARSDGEVPEEDRAAEARGFVVTILPGDRPAAATPLAPLPPAEGARMEARVERVLAAVQAELAAGAALGLRAGPNGALTLSFPLPIPDLGIAGAVLTLSPGSLDLALRGAGPLDAIQEAALRDLAASLALRHPDRTVRLHREEAEEGRGGEVPGSDPLPFSPFSPLRRT